MNIEYTLYTFHLSYIPWFNERKLAKHQISWQAALDAVDGSSTRKAGGCSCHWSIRDAFHQPTKLNFHNAFLHIHPAPKPTKNPSNGSTLYSPVVPHGDTCESPRRVWNLQFTKFWPRAVDENQPVSLTCWCCFSKWAQLKTSAQQPACWELLAEFTKRKITWEKKCRKITSKLQWFVIFHHHINIHSVTEEQRFGKSKVVSKERCVSKIQGRKPGTWSDIKAAMAESWHPSKWPKKIPLGNLPPGHNWQFLP